MIDRAAVVEINLLWLGKHLGALIVCINLLLPLQIVCINLLLPLHVLIKCIHALRHITSPLLVQSRQSALFCIISVTSYLASGISRV